MVAAIWFVLATPFAMPSCIVPLHLVQSRILVRLSLRVIRPLVVVGNSARMNQARASVADQEHDQDNVEDYQVSLDVILHILIDI